MVTVVYFVKHWDNDTKGYMEFSAPNLGQAIQNASRTLLLEAVEDGADTRLSPEELFTITKAELDHGTNWNGGPGRI